MSAVLRKQPDRFVESAIDGEIVLMDMDSGGFFTLRGTAVHVWRLIDGHRDRAAILAALRDAHEGDPDVVARDLDQFLDQVREAGLVA